jgi:hypothetical protein
MYSMELRKRSVLMMGGPAVMAFLLGAILTGEPLLNTDNQFSEALRPTGYVTVSVVREGNEIYHYEDHNAITEAGVDFIADQISDSPSSSVSAQFIGLTTTDITPDDDDTSLSGEITSGGLERAAGTFGGLSVGVADNDDNYTITKTFTASATHTAVQGAGLFTDATVGSDTMVAINEFSSVNLASGDQLTITWTIDLGLTLT